MKNPYKIFGPVVVNFSGGRSSGFMLKHIIDAWNGKLPSNVIPIFCNTGKERPETLDFVQRCEQEWGVKIIWLEYRYNPNANGGQHDPKNIHIKVNYDSASRNGEPFSELLLQKKYLPNPITRLCTTELKVKTVQRYLLRERGWRRNKYINVIGIRYDEKNRWKRILSNNRRCLERLPMVDAKHDKDHVARFWKESNFDLGIESSRGNCDLCFLKKKQILIDSIREDNKLVEWWIHHEQVNIKKEQWKNQNMAWFNKERSYTELKELAMSPQDDSLFDFAEKQGFLDCFCTD